MCQDNKVRLWICLLTWAVLVYFCVLVPDTFGSGRQDRWFDVSLEHGETASGYVWGAGARVRKGSHLTDVCATLSLTEPQREDAPYVEGTDATDCGSVRRSVESVVSSVSMGQSASSVSVVEALYRPIVRKVRLELSTGEKKVFLPRVPMLAPGGKRVVPMFRYLVLPLEGQVCIRRILSFDGGGRLINRESPEEGRSCLLGSS
jgi:hypothetical protein